MCGSSTDLHKILGKRLNESQGKNPKNKVGITTTVANFIFQMHNSLLRHKEALQQL